jgi:hypothetical protein
MLAISPTIERKYNMHDSAPAREGEEENGSNSQKIYRHIQRGKKGVFAHSDAS